MLKVKNQREPQKQLCTKGEKVDKLKDRKTTIFQLFHIKNRENHLKT